MNFTAHLCRQKLDTFCDRREGGTLENVTGKRTNAAKATTPLKIFAQTNPLIRFGAFEGAFSFNGGSGGIMQPPARVNDNRDNKC